MVECEVECGGLAQGGQEPGMVAPACNLSILRLVFPYGLTREPENLIVSNVWEQLTQTQPRWGLPVMASYPLAHRAA